MSGKRQVPFCRQSSGTTGVQCSLPFGRMWVLSLRSKFRSVLQDKVQEDSYRAVAGIGEILKLNIFLFCSKVVAIYPNFPNYAVLCPTVLVLLLHFCVFFLVFPKNPAAISYITLAPFSSLFFCSILPLLPQF